MIEKANGFSRCDDRRRHYVLAGASALLTKLPIRSLDLLRGRVGHEFRRDSEGWIADLVTSKTGVPIHGRLANALTRYLDAVLLQDTGAQHLWMIYDERLGQALFGNASKEWASYGDNWLWQNMSKVTGHRPRIVRTLIYEACHLDDTLDTHVAAALWGHRTVSFLRRLG